MNQKILVMVLSLFFLGACVQNKPVVVSGPPVNLCPMPSGYKLAPAISQAEKAVTVCPDRFDAVFMKLLEIARNSPAKENAVLIQDMLKGLVESNRISQTYAKKLYRQYFSVHFVSMPDVKTYNLAGELDAIKRNLQNELTLKKMGIVECCGDKESYRRAEAEYARVINLMENYALNEEYMKSGR